MISDRKMGPCPLTVRRMRYFEKERKKRGKTGDLWSAFGSSNEKRGDGGKIVVK